MEARVPRYFFNLHDDHTGHDAEGTELASHEAARLTAVQLASEILRDEALRQAFDEEWFLEVLDETGRIICSVNVNVCIPTAAG